MLSHSAMKPLPQCIFDVYALSLPRGHGFDEDTPKGAWESADNVTLGVLTRNRSRGRYGVLIMRRREDDVWIVLRRTPDAFDEAAAMSIIEQACTEIVDKVPLNPGVKRRPPLAVVGGKEPSGIFKLLAHPCRHRGAWMLNQLYLAMPNPDDNWASDCRTGNFHTRLWEALLNASFKEQGLYVTQDHPSPDFHVVHRLGYEALVEAVTTNPVERYDHANAGPADVPTNRRERVLGSAAVRFAKTIKSKLDKGYPQLPHVIGKPFALAVADFHAPGSMMWSRAALMCYLYGTYPREMELDGVAVAVAEFVDVLLGEEKIPSGLFLSPTARDLSAVIFSNAVTLAKLSRVAMSYGGPGGDYRYIRIGQFADDTPGALRGIPFCMDVNSDEYRALWKPYPYEPWTAELEVFHNPYATHPIDPGLFPEATHWLVINGVLDCKRHYGVQVLQSQTVIQDADKPIPCVEDLVFVETTEGIEITNDDELILGLGPTADPKNT
jgi:hypothetical protein